MSAPRLVPELAFPPYSYVTGRWPHPLRDPAGHSFGHVEVPLPRFESQRWKESRKYLFAIDLFNHGYYWEAHEAWEALWHSVDRAGVAGDFFKGLIKLAAAGVKAREKRPEGVRRHGRRAHEIFETIADCFRMERTWFGIYPDELIVGSRRLANGDATFPVKDLPVEVVLDIRLLTPLTVFRSDIFDPQ